MARQHRCDICDGRCVTGTFGKFFRVRGRAVTWGLMWSNRYALDICDGCWGLLHDTIKALRTDDPHECPVCGHEHGGK